MFVLVWVLVSFLGPVLAKDKDYRLELISSDSYSVVFSFELNRYSTEYRAESLCIKVEGAGRTRCPFSPDLPVIRRYLVVSQGDIRTIMEEARIDSFFAISVVRRGFPRKKDADEPDLDFDCSEELNKFFVVKRIGKMRGVDVGFLEIYPFVKNNGWIKVLKSCRLRIEFNTPIDYWQGRLFSSCFARIFHLIFDNAFNLNGISFDLPLVLFIAPERYREALYLFLQVELKRGFRFVFASVEEIGLSPESIKAFISDAYHSWEIPPSFVVLVGDIEDVPTNFTSAPYMHPTDLYYACVDGDDFFPDIFIGRISISDLTELQTYVEKVVKYEMGELNSLGWLSRPSFVGCGTDGLWELVISTHKYAIENYFTPPRFEPETLFAIYGTTGNQVLNSAFDGRLLINYSGHGGTDGWGNPSVNNSDLARLSGSERYSLVISNACLTGKFSEPVCFGEAWLRIRNGGAIGFIGATDNTYWDEDDIWERRFYDGIFLDSLFTLGEAMLYANLELMRSGTPLDQYYFEVYNILGPPDFFVYLGVPESIVVRHQERYYSTLSRFPITITPSSATVSLLFDDSLVFSGKTETGFLEATPFIIPLPPASFELNVTSYPYFLPYKARIPVVYAGGIIFDPDTIFICSPARVEFFAYDSTGEPIVGLNILVAGLLDTVSSMTDTLGRSTIEICPRFGEDLIVRGSFPDSVRFAEYLLPIGGALSPFVSFGVRSRDLGLTDTIPVGLQSELIVRSELDSFYLVVEQENFRQVYFSSERELVVPYSTNRRGKVVIHFAREGYNLVKKGFPVVEPYGIFDAIVRDSLTYEPVSGCLVELFDSTGTLKFFSGYTDSLGHCRASVPLRCKRYLLSIRKFGYRLYNEIIWLRARGTTEVTIIPVPFVMGNISVENELDILIPFRAYLYDSVSDSLRYAFHSPYGEPVNFSVVAGAYKINIYSPGYRSLTTTLQLDSSFAVQLRTERVRREILIVDDGSGHAYELGEALQSYGYLCEVWLNPVLLPELGSYNLVLWLSGRNSNPVPESAIPILINYISQGGKVLFEGGEIVFRLASDITYPNLETELLHIFRWTTDNPGESLFISALALGSGVGLVPNILSPVVRPRGESSDYYDRFDVFTGDERNFIYVTRSGRSGLAFVYERSVGIAGFAYPDAFVEPSAAKDILINIVEHLIFPFRYIQSVVGVVKSASGDYLQGVSVRLSNLSRVYSATTDFWGRFVISNVEPAVYELSFACPAYRETSFVVNLTPDSLFDNLIVTLYDASRIELPIPSDFFVSDLIPNPFNSFSNLKISVLKKESINIEVFDIAGRMVRKERVDVSGEIVYRLDLSNFSSGVYFVRLGFDKHKVVKRAVYLK